jgi:hypothetical protein
MNETKMLNKNELTKDLLRVLTAQYNALRVARSDTALLDIFAALLKYLRSANSDDLERILAVHASLRISNTTSRAD